MSAPRIFTHGCRLNAWDSAAMARIAEDAGAGDTVVVNTCAVTAEAVRKARQDVRRLRRAHPEAPLVVTGCAAQTEPARFAAMPEVDAILGNAEKLDPGIWAGLAAGTAPRVAVGDVMAEARAPAPTIDGLPGRTRAVVQVQTGCDHRCTFCIIPYGRGNSRSVPAETVAGQVRRLAETHAEVVLTGVDLTSWGADLPGRPRLGDLVGAILRDVPDLPRLRLSSIDGVEVDEALWRAIAEEPRLMPHLHLSLQSGDDLILKRMRRRHLAADAVAFCARARRVRPDISFGADLIAGFPTESDAAFANTLAHVQECGLAFLHVFPYSARPGTPAARMPQVPGEVVRDRAARLRAMGDAVRARHLDALVGTTQSVLMEGPRRGRAAGFAEVRLDADRPAGTIQTVRIAGATGAALLA